MEELQTWWCLEFMTESWSTSLPSQLGDGLTLFQEPCTSCLQLLSSSLHRRVHTPFWHLACHTALVCTSRQSIMSQLLLPISCPERWCTGEGSDFLWICLSLLNQLPWDYEATRARKCSITVDNSSYGLLNCVKQIWVRPTYTVCEVVFVRETSSL